MNLLKKILLIAYSFCITVISAVLLIIPFDKRVLNNIYDFLYENVYVSFTSKLVFFLIISVILALSLIFLVSGVKRNKQNIVIKSVTELGELSISIASIESLAFTSIKNLKGIKEIKVDAERFAAGVVVTLKLIVYPEVIVTEITKKIQSMIKSDIETATGVKVFKVLVKIDNVTNYTMRSTVD
jgi:uncharacterized alkaline shock family protein YloU